MLIYLISLKDNYGSRKINPVELFPWYDIFAVNPLTSINGDLRD
jgi:hypothetical protein